LFARKEVEDMVSYIGKRTHTIYCPHIDRTLGENGVFIETRFKVPYQSSKKHPDYKKDDFEFIFQFCTACDKAMLKATDTEEEE